jgi:Cu2+-exporting ATPase
MSSARRGCSTGHPDEGRFGSGAAGRGRHRRFDKTGTLTTGTPRIATPPSRRPTFRRPRRLPNIRSTRHRGPSPPISAALRSPICRRSRKCRASGSKVFWTANASGSAGPTGRAEITDGGGRRDRGGLAFAREGGAVSGFVLSEALRPEAVEAVSALAENGMELEVLSGDAAPAVEAIARRTGIESYRAGSRRPARSPASRRCRPKATAC